MSVSMEQTEQVKSPTIQDLIRVLRKLDGIKRLKVSRGWIQVDGALSQRALDLCYELLATPPAPSSEYIRALRSAGIQCYAGERDSFGWLTGVIELPSGRKLCFG
jgi:hypothetical protein